MFIDNNEPIIAQGKINLPPVNKNCSKIQIRTVVSSKLLLIDYLIRFFIHHMKKVNTVEIDVILIYA